MPYQSYKNPRLIIHSSLKHDKILSHNCVFSTPNHINTFMFVLFNCIQRQIGQSAIFPEVEQGKPCDFTSDGTAHRHVYTNWSVNKVNTEMQNKTQMEKHCYTINVTNSQRTAASTMKGGAL